MTDFDFSNVKVVPSTTVPSLSRVKESRPNPLAAKYAESAEAGDKWRNMTLPGKTEVRANETGKQITSYGSTIKLACSYLRKAAEDFDRGVSFRYKDNEDGTVTLHFQAKPKRSTATV